MTIKKKIFIKKLKMINLHFNKQQRKSITLPKINSNLQILVNRKKSIQKYLQIIIKILI